MPGRLVAPKSDSGGWLDEDKSNLATVLAGKAGRSTTRDDGAKGQTAMQGRAGAGLASPAGIGAGAGSIDVIKNAQASDGFATRKI